MRGWALAAVAAASLGGPGAAAAADEPGLGEAVYAPYVKNGITEVEMRGGRLLDGDQAGGSGAVVEIEHGFSDRFSLALVGELEDAAGERGKLDSVGVEGVAYLGQLPGTGVDVGGYLEYEQRLHDESGVVEAKLLLARRFGAVHTLVNLVASQPLTERPGEGATQFGYAAQATLEVRQDLEAGVQAFGALGTSRSPGGRQEHFLGPVARWEVRPRWAPGELELEAAYLLPLGAARRETDGQVRLELEWERRF
jgi:hypothetical protein